MPLSPQEQAELEQLVSSMSEQELAEIEKQFSAPLAEPSIKDRAIGLAKSALGAQHAFRGKLLEAGTLGNISEDMQPGLKSAAEQHPAAAKLGSVAGLIGSTAAIGAPAGALAKGTGLLGKMGLGAGVGAATGAAAKPSEEGLTGRAENAAIGGALGGLFSGVGQGVRALADKSRMVEKVKDSATLSKSVKSQIDDALEGVNRNYIKPRADELRSLLQGKSVNVNPERMRGVDPRIDQMVEKFVPPANAEGMSQLSAKNAQRFKRIFDAQANYANAKPFEPGATARGESAKRAADVLRSKVAGVDPRVDSLNQEMAEAIRLRNALERASQSAPISSIKGAPGTDKGSLIDAIDKMSNSKLEKLSSDVQSAKDLIINPINFVKPLEAPNELRKAAVRGAAGLARGADAVTPPQADIAIINALMQAKRKK